MEVSQEKPPTNGNSVAAFIVFLWVILGILGFLTSIVCFAYKGTFMQNWVGLLTAATLGPFYWIYFAFVGDNYCSMKGKQQVSRQVVKQVGGRPKKGGRRSRR